jgi:predicted metallopeptidase
MFTAYIIESMDDPFLDRLSNEEKLKMSIGTMAHLSDIGSISCSDEIAEKLRKIYFRNYKKGCKLIRNSELL